MKMRCLAELGAVAVLVVLIAGATGCSSGSSGAGGPPGGGGGLSATLLANAVALDAYGTPDGALTFAEANSDPAIVAVTQAEFDVIDASNAGSTTDGFLSLSELVSDVGGAVVTGDTQNGGQLYDKFWTVIGVAATEPATDHTIWATQTEGNARTGSDTWRCKECHGWDYKGVAGAYAPGSSHATGFKGIFTLVTATTDFEVFDLIKTDHEYGVAGLTDPEILDLTDFVGNPALVDTDNIIVAGAFNGTAATGQVLYDTTRTCALCHGATGLNMPPVGGTNDYFADYPGLLAVDNPQEFQHKINYGQPGPGAMAFAAALTETETSDLGAYAQTLPDMLALPGGTLDVINGGRLYDKWWADAGDTPPATDHPFWADQTASPPNARTGPDTWRCKECHGWDYKGAAGAYEVGVSSHATGFAGIFGTTQTLQEVYNTIWTDHQLGNKMTDADIQDAAEFVVNGQLDVDTIIDGAGLFIGDGTPGGAGSIVYDTTRPLACSSCHGADGLMLPPLGSTDTGFDAFPGFLSNDNPQEFQHKANYGHPGSSMDFASTLTVAETGDLGAFSQTLPVAR